MNHLVAMIEKLLPNETYDIKLATFVRCALRPFKVALEMEGGVVYQLDLDVGGLVVLAICGNQFVNPRTQLPPPK